MEGASLLEALLQVLTEKACYEGLVMRHVLSLSLTQIQEHKSLSHTKPKKRIQLTFFLVGTRPLSPFSLSLSFFHLHTFMHKGLHTLSHSLILKQSCDVSLSPFSVSGGSSRR